MHKNTQLFNLCKTLKYHQRIIFSDQAFEVSWFTNSTQSFREKPRGLWYSFGPAWIEYLSDMYQAPNKTDPVWCLKRIHWVTHVYKLHLNRKKIYTIKNERDFDRFVKNYEKKELIRWDLLQERGWQGIEIRYMEHKEQNHEWYNGWDCSSGCVWDRRSLNRVKLLKAWEITWKAVNKPVSTFI